MTEEILLRMGLDSKSVDSGLSSLKTKLSQFGGEARRSFQSAMGPLTSLIGTGALMATLNNAVEKVKSIRLGSQKSGLGAEDFQRMAEAGDEFFISSEKIAGSLEKLNIKIGQARSGTEGAAEAFRKWGIAVEGKNTKEIIDAMADRMAKMHDPAERSAMAVELMGRGAAELVPLLEKGADALERMKGEQAIFSEEDLKNIEQAKKDFEEMKDRATIWGGWFISFIADLGKAAGTISAVGFGSQNTAQLAEKARAQLEAQRQRIAAEVAAEDAAQEASEAAKAKTQEEINQTAEKKEQARLDKEAEERRKKEEDWNLRNAEMWARIGDRKRKAQRALAENEDALNNARMAPGKFTIEDLAAADYSRASGAAQDVLTLRQWAKENAMMGNIPLAEQQLGRADEIFRGLADANKFLEDPMAELLKTNKEARKELEHIGKAYTPAGVKIIPVNGE